MRKRKRRRKMRRKRGRKRGRKRRRRRKKKRIWTGYLACPSVRKEPVIMPFLCLSNLEGTQNLKV